MKSALCLFGIIGGRTGKDGAGGDADFEYCYEHYKKNIFDHNDMDVFIHTWSIQHKEALEKLYMPKKSIYQKQIIFDGEDRNRHLALSRWYSSKQSLLLKKQYEEENNFKYDMVMVGRFDLVWLTPFKFEDFDPSNFYVSNLNETKRNGAKVNRSPHEKRFADLWFFAGSEIMDYFSEIYDNVDELHQERPTRKGYDPHSHVWDWMYRHPVYRDRIVYTFYLWYDYENYRRYVLGEIKK